MWPERISFLNFFVGEYRLEKTELVKLLNLPLVFNRILLLFKRNDRPGKPPRPAKKYKNIHLLNREEF